MAGAFLKGIENGIERTPALEYYTLGDNTWKNGQCWPPANTEEAILYLNGAEDDSAAGNGAACGHGSLSFRAPETGGRDSYLYDPGNPSVHIIDMSENELEVPEDYTVIEQREDMLSYTTEPFKESFTITGELAVKLYVSCDCPDTDLWSELQM